MVAEHHATDSLRQALRDGRRTHALFLDVDGTLIDIAPHPDAVYVPDGLPALLSGLHHYLDGAVALVSGREITDIDRLMSPVVVPAAGAHGARIRVLADQAAATGDAAHALPDALRSSLADLAAGHQLLIEDKVYSVAIHYRNSPGLADMLREQMEQVLDSATGGDENRPALMAGKMIYEVKYNTFDKGTALDAFLAVPPFAGRRPIVIGDDTTDEYAFARALTHGGLTFSVGRALPGAGAVFESPEQVRQALQQLLAEALTDILKV